MPAKALAGLGVVELSSLISGPYTGRLLADLGADVIKVEPPGGDESRRFGPFPGDVPHPEGSGLFLYLNANKRGVTLDVSVPTGRDLLMKLLSQADVLIENNPPQRMSDLRLDFESLRAVNPNLVVTSVTPFGQAGPWRDYGGYDLNVFHASGMGYLGGDPRPERYPLKAGGHQADFTAGVAGAVGTMVGLFGRELNGEAQHVDVSAWETLSAGMEIWLLVYEYYRRTLWRSERPGVGPGNILACREGYIHQFTIEEEQWQRFLGVMGDPEWADNELFQNRTTRGQYWEALEPLLLEWTMERTATEVFRVCQRARVPFAPVNDMADLLSNPQLAAREFFLDLEHAEAGTQRYPGACYRFSATPARIERPAPRLGEHNQEVFCGELGIACQDLADLRRTGVI